MSNFAIIRLGKDSLADIKTIDALHASPATPLTFVVHCKQVPTELEASDYVFFCFGSDNSQGAPTEWVRGVRALGTIVSKTGGPGYNDPWHVSVEIKVVLPHSVVRRDLLAHAPTAYYWCSGVPTIGIEANSQQTIQMIKAFESDQNVSALVYALSAHSPIFKTDILREYPALKDLFGYEPPAPLGGAAEISVAGSKVPFGATNTIFFGPPGTGKSSEVNEMVASSPMFRTQFHPEYSHADFIGSYRPVVGSEADATNKILGHDGILGPRPVNYFAFVPGPLALALECAFASSCHVFLVIEEINRGDCAAIFGDAFQLLDRDDAGRSEFGITPKLELLAYFKARGINYDIAADGKLYLPPNLSLLATMNTSDQSLYPMDSAFKRRWQWVTCPIDFEQLLVYTGGVRPFLDDGKDKFDWIELVERINKKIVQDRMEDKQLGPWFIKPAKDGLVPWEAMLNKCLFYLWHDVFKDEQLLDLSPFKADGPKVFGEVQANIRDNGLAAGFKPELLIPIAAAAGPVTTEGEQAAQPPQTQN